MFSNAKTGNSRRRSRGSRSRRTLFASKRKRDYFSEFDPEESPTKYRVINSDSSEEGDDSPPTPELRPRHVDSGLKASLSNVDKLINDSPPYNALGKNIYDTEDELFFENETALHPSTPVLTRNQDMEITEFATPQKQQITYESESPPKTPLLGAHREKVDLEISEYVSPARGSLASNSAISEASQDISTSDETDDEIPSKPSGVAIKKTSRSMSEILRGRKKAKQLNAELAYRIQDCPNVSLIVLKSFKLDNAEGKLNGILIWTLCHDVLYDIERYVVLIQTPGKSIKPGVCIRLFPPWTLAARFLKGYNHQMQKQISMVVSGILLNLVTIALSDPQIFKHPKNNVSLLPYVDEEIIHSIHLYQIILPSLLDITTEKIREVVNKSSVTFSKFQGSIPGSSGLHVLNSIPQLQYNSNTISKQSVAYRTPVNIDAMVWLTFSIQDALHVLVKDCDMTFAIIEIPSAWFSGRIQVNVFTRFTNLVYGEKITYHTFAPLFSVMDKLGSSQETYVKLLWRPGSQLSVVDISPVPVPVIEDVHVPLQELQNTTVNDLRVSVKGVIYVLTQSELFLFESGTRIRINVLSSFKKKEFIKSTDVGRMIEISLLRVTDQKAYTLDQYSMAKFVDDVRYSIRPTQTSISSTPLQ